MNLRVEVENGEPIRGRLLYLTSEYSFMYQASDDAELCRRTGGEGVMSIVADTLQLEVGVETGKLLFAWGYLPHNSWLEGEFPPPEMAPGILKLENVHGLEPGVSMSISRGSQWHVEFNRSNGWLRVTVPHFGDVNYVEIAAGVVVGVEGAQIVSIWLCPEFIE